MLDAAQVHNGIVQVIQGKLMSLLALCTLRNERQAKHIILTLNGIHPEIHEVDTSTTKITGYVSIELEPPAGGNCAERICFQANEMLSLRSSRSAVTSPPFMTKSNRGIISGLGYF